MLMLSIFFKTIFSNATILSGHMSTYLASLYVLYVELFFTFYSFIPLLVLFWFLDQSDYAFTSFGFYCLLNFLGKNVLRQTHLYKVHAFSQKTAIIQSSNVFLPSTQIRFYSSNWHEAGIGEENKGYRDLFEYNKLLVWLPSIIFNGGRDNSMNKTSDIDFC
jgi:hypothetical protein